MKAKDEKVMKTTTMLMKAIQQSGGSVDDQFLHMTVAEFIAEVAAPNNIEFRYKPFVNVSGDEYIFSGNMDVKEKKQVDKMMKELAEKIKNSKHATIDETINVLMTIPNGDCILEKCESIVTITTPFHRRVKN